MADPKSETEKKKKKNQPISLEYSKKLSKTTKVTSKRFSDQSE